MDNNFLKLIRPIVKKNRYKELKKYKHHKNHSIYYHSIKVAYIAYKKHKNNKRINLNSLIKGALLHDYYLYDWHDKNKKTKWHGFTHPNTAYKNAIIDYKLSNIEKDIILNHMFPLTIKIPKTREGRIICVCDKIASIDDYMN